MQKWEGLTRKKWEGLTQKMRMTVFEWLKGLTVKMRKSDSKNEKD